MINCTLGRHEGELSKVDLEGIWIRFKRVLIINYTEPFENTARKTSSSKRLSELNLGENNPMFGKKQSLSSRLKLSKALKGRISSLRGRNLSEEHKRKNCYFTYWKISFRKIKIENVFNKKKQAYKII